MIPGKPVIPGRPAIPTGAEEPTETPAARPAVRVITDCRELTRRLALPREAASDEAAARYPLAIPEALLARIAPSDPDDPILRQFLPRAEECLPAEGFSQDPLGERGENTPAVLRKYAGRALVVCPGACAANCRFCFRRHYRGEAPKSLAAVKEALSAVGNDRSVSEIILSGGDPLGLEPGWLKALLYYIKGLPYVNRVRVHTRRAILLPNEADEAFFSLWSPDLWRGKQRVFVFHINHPGELTDEALRCLRTLRSLGVHLFVQTVLLRGVNDSSRVLADLYERLFSYGVLPYYLHQLDRVDGAAHFEVDPAEGRRIVEELRALLPGYLVPRYVREIPGESAKAPL